MTTFAWGSASVQVAFQNNPFDASPTWTDITRYVTGFTTSMGRQHELQQVNPSQATIQLNNQQGQFSPWNSNSPYYYSATGLTPGHPVRILAQPHSASVSSAVYYGYAKGWVPAYGMTKSTMTLQCYDVLALLNLNTMDADGYGVYPLANATAFWRLDDPARSLTAANSAGSVTLTPNGGATFQGTAGPILNQPAGAVTTIGSNSYLKTTSLPGGASVGTVDGWFKSTDATDGVQLIATTYVTLATEPSTGFAQFTVGASVYSGSVNVCDGGWHYLAGTVSLPNAALYVDGQLVASGTPNADIGGPTAIVGGGFGSAPNAVADVAVYPIALAASVIATQYAIGTAGFLVQDSGARVNAVLNAAGVPAGLNNVGTGNITVQAATSSLATTTIMSYLNQVVNTERGFLYQDASGVVQYRNRHYVYENTSSNTSQATFGYAGGQLHYFSTGLVPSMDDLDDWNNIPVNRTGGLVQTADDATSQDAQGRRTLTGYTNMLFTNDIESADLAGGLLYQYKNPAPRIRALTMDSTISNGANMAQMLGRQLLDRVTVNWRPLDGSAVDFTQQSLIEQVTHTVTTETWTTTFAVTPIGTENFARYDISTYGTGIYGF